MAGPHMLYPSRACTLSMRLRMLYGSHPRPSFLFLFIASLFINYNIVSNYNGWIVHHFKQLLRMHELSSESSRGAAQRLVTNNVASFFRLERCLVCLEQGLKSRATHTN